MRTFSIRPTLTLRGRTFKGIRGWSGKPLHPPLTDQQRPGRGGVGRGHQGLHRQRALDDEHAPLGLVPLPQGGVGQRPVVLEPVVVGIVDADGLGHRPSLAGRSPVAGCQGRYGV